MDLEETLKALKVHVDAPKTGVVKPARYREVTEACEMIKAIVLFENPDAEIKVVENPLQTGSMIIEVVTNDVTVYDTAEFAEATKNADIFQMYPRTDDKIQFDILFEDVIEYTFTDTPQD